MALEAVVRCVACGSSHPIGSMPSSLGDLVTALPESWSVGTFSGLNWAACSDGCRGKLDYAKVRRYYDERMDRFKGERANETLDIWLGR